MSGDQPINKISDIINQFNSEKRINEGLVSYGLEERRSNVVFDPYEKLREDLIFSEVIESIYDPTSARVLDIGCGFGHLVLRLLQEGVNCEGIDVAENVVRIAEDLLKSHGYEQSCVYEGNFLDKTFESDYSAIIANGVIWYYEDRINFIEKISSALKPGGKAFIVHRNDLFNMFALNEGTIDFFGHHFSSAGMDSGADTLKQTLSSGVPGLAQPIKKHTSSVLQKPYDNPLEAESLYAKAGLTVKHIRAVYVHPAPPRFLPADTPQAVYAQAHAAYAKSWQGLFMGSQFLVVAEKA